MPNERTNREEVKFRSKPTIYLNEETGEVFNPETYHFKVTSSEKRCERDENNPNTILLEWIHTCKITGVKSEQLKFNF